MSGAFKSVAKVFSPIASLLGMGPKKPKLDPSSTQSSGLKAYDPSKNPAATPLERNPNIVGGPGAEAMLKQWDAAKAALEALGKKPPRGAKGDNFYEVNRWEKKAKPIQAQIDSYEASLLNNLWTAPPQAPTPAPAPVANPPAATPAPATIAPKPATPAPAAAPRPAPVPVAAETPAAAAATSIVGTASAGTLGTNISSGGGGRRGRRGRVASLLGTIGGGDSERFGG